MTQRAFDTFVTEMNAWIARRNVTTSALALQQDAGQARWRELHEVAVVADFLARLGVDTAVRYFASEGIEIWRTMVEFQKHAERGRRADCRRARAPASG